MLKLEDGMLLYHGSYAIVDNIDLDMCKSGKDFGKGFYLTSSYEQAKSFVPLSIKREVGLDSLNKDQQKGYISVYRLNLNDSIKSFLFKSADKDWLHYVASNRRISLFVEQRNALSMYDIIAGKIANDRTARTLQLYITGAYGDPGTEEADDIAITTLLPNRLEDQYCFRSIAGINSLEFLRSDICYVK